MMVFLRVLLLLLSMAGFCLYFRKRWNIPLEFLPALYCTICICLLFFAGILNVLLECALVCAAAGIFLLILERKELTRLSKRNWAVLGIFCLALGYAAYLLMNTYSSHYDDFSHWGLVVREMLRDDRMPNFQNELIEFQAYPLGSALWIYYVCRLAGIGEGGYFLAQQILQISCFLPVLVWLNKRNWSLAFSVIGYTLYALTSGVPINTLLVDTLLAVIAVALFSICWFYREEKQRMIFISMPLVFALLQVKNSGIFFAILFWLWAGAQIYGARHTDKTLLRRFFLWDILLPGGSVLIWQRHVRLVFPYGAWSLHAMTPQNYKQVFLGKSLDNITSVFQNAFQRIFVNDNVLWLLVVITALLLIYAAVNRRESQKSALYQLCANWGILLFYLLGICAMYIFSMPQDQADNLAGFNRYMSTCGIFLYGINVIWLLRNVQAHNLNRKVLAGVVTAIVAAAPFWNLKTGEFRFASGFSSLLQRPQGSQVRETLVSCLEQFQPEKGSKKWLVYQQESDSGYLYYVMRYELETDNVRIIPSFQEYATVEDMASDGDYLLIWTPDDASDQFLRDNGYDSDCGKQGFILKLTSEE